MTEVVTAVSQAAGADAWEAHPSFGVYDSEFAAALGPAPRLALAAETDAHEGPVYIPGEDVLYFTSLPGKVDIPARGTAGAYVKRLAMDYWPYLADADLGVQRTFGIDEYTGPHHSATVPHTLVVAPGLVVDKVYVGYWFWGRPSPFQLWEDLQDLLRRTKADLYPTSAQARAAWNAPMPADAGVSGHA
jgi:hypothetical protein